MKGIRVNMEAMPAITAKKIQKEHDLTLN